MGRTPYVADYESYRNHYGAGALDVFRGDVYQAGYGLGGILSSIFKTVAPLLKPAAKVVGKNLLRTGIKVAADVASGSNDLKSSLKQRAREGLGTLVSDIAEPFSKRAKTTTGKVQKTRRRAQRRRRKKDIFDK